MILNGDDISFCKKINLHIHAINHISILLTPLKNYNKKIIFSFELHFAETIFLNKCFRQSFSLTFSRNHF